MAILKESKEKKFYCSNHSTILVESGNATFIENGETSGSSELRRVDINDLGLKFLHLKLHLR